MSGLSSDVNLVSIKAGRHNGEAGLAVRRREGREGQRRGEGREGERRGEKGREEGEKREGVLTGGAPWLHVLVTRRTGRLSSWFVPSLDVFSFPPKKGQSHKDSTIIQQS